MRGYTLDAGDETGPLNTRPRQEAEVSEGHCLIFPSHSLPLF